MDKGEEGFTARGTEWDYFWQKGKGWTKEENK